MPTLSVVLKVMVFPKVESKERQAALTKVNHKMLFATFANQCAYTCARLRVKFRIRVWATP